MIRAYTAIHGCTDGPHWDVGPTFEREDDAEAHCQPRHDTSYVEVVSWIDDFTEIDCGFLLFRTDGIHEASWVVSEKPSELSNSYNEGAVRTRFVSAEEAQSE